MDVLETLDSLLNHADNTWEAEEEIADQLAKSRQGVVTQIAVLLLAALWRASTFKPDWTVIDGQSTMVILGISVHAATPALVLVILGLVLLMISLAFALSPRRMPTRKGSLFSSAFLHLHPADLDPPPVNPIEAKAAILARVMKAARDLHRKNQKEALHIGRAQEILMLALVFIISALLLLRGLPGLPRGISVSTNSKTWRILPRSWGKLDSPRPIVMADCPSARSLYPPVP